MTEKQPGLTTLQQRFVEEYVANNFKDAKNAALRAGASSATAKNAYLNLRGSAVVNEAIEEVREFLRTVSRDRLLGIANEGIETLREVLADKDAPASAKVSAAKAAIELSGVGAPQEINATGRQTWIVKYDEPDEEGNGNSDSDDTTS